MMPKYGTKLATFFNQFKPGVEKLQIFVKGTRGRIVARGAVARVDIRHFSIENFFIICLYFFLPFYVTAANIHPQNQHYNPPHHVEKFFRDPTNFDSRVSGIDKTVLEVFWAAILYNIFLTLIPVIYPQCDDFHHIIVKLLLMMLIQFILTMPMTLQMISMRKIRWKSKVVA